MSAFESAIDDSFDPAPKPLEDEEVSEDTLFDNAYNGPRDGRWEVASSVGSFVDDRCPTVYGYRPQARPAGKETRIDDGLVKELMQATIEHKRAAAAAQARQGVAPGAVQNHHGQISSAPSSVKVSRPFVVPPLRNKPFSPVAPSHKDQRKPSQKAPVTTRQNPRANNDLRTTARCDVAAPVAEAAKARADAPRGFTRDKSTIRILGKNGEEAFVSLPSLAKSVHAASHRTQQRSVSVVPVGRSLGSAGDFNTRETVIVPEVAEVIRNEEQSKQQSKQQNEQQNKQKDKQQKKEHNQKQKQQKQRQNEEEQPIAEPPRVEREGFQRAASALMSGALPAPSREPSQAPQSADNSCRDSGIAMSDYGIIAKTSSSRASSAGPGSAISQGVFGIAQKIVKIPSTTSSAKRSNPRSTAAILEGSKELGLGMTTVFPTKERMSDRSDHGRAKQLFSSRYGSQPSARRDSGSLQRQQQQQQQQDNGSNQGTVRSNYKPPTVVSASSSASITHSFGGMYQEGMYPEGFVLQHQYPIERQETGISSHRGDPDQPGSIKNGSSKSRMNDASGRASSKQSRSSSHVHHTDRLMSVQSDRGSSVRSGVNYAFDVASLRQSQSDSQAHRSDQSRSARSDKGSSVRSVVSYTSGVACFKQRQPGSRATSGVHSISEQPSQALGPRCPSHSPVPPLAPSQPFAPTNFAGGGWISPHPLSSIAGVSPQSAVSTVYASADGPGHCGTLTYSEWRAHRDALGSDAGSYAGSHIPSDVGLQAVPPAAYNYPPPISYVGSYNPVTRQSPQHPLQMDGEPGWVSQYFDPLQGSKVRQSPVSVRNQRGFSQSHRSAHSESESTSTTYNISLYNQPVQHHSPIAASQNAGWSSPPQDDHLASGHGPVYNVGLTPTELSSYQSQLGSTISRYSSQISHVQREQTPPQPNYEVWNNAQSHSSRRSSPQHSIHNFPPSLSYPRVKSQLAMPWDPTTSQVNSRSAVSNRQPSSQAGLSGRTASAIGGAGGIKSRLQSNRSSSRGSVGSRSSFDLADSQVTYGTVQWQNLEIAEEGRGGFQDPQFYKMW